MGNLDGQVALITGGARGLGRSIALAMAAEGAAVVIDDVFKEGDQLAADALAQEIIDAGGRALGVAEDVTTSVGAAAMVDQAVHKFGRLDILVTCAGNVVRGLIQDMNEDDWDSVIRLHLRGHFLSMQAAVRQMLTQDYGRILTVGSRGAFFSVPSSKAVERGPRKPSSSPYSAAKAGILGLTTTTALELWETGINVNCLLPSAQTQLFPESKARMVGGTPASESLDPDDVAPTAVYLCSPDAGDFSGKIVYASGGDIIIFGQQLAMEGTRMVRKAGRWEQAELAAVLPPLLGRSAH